MDWKVISIVKINIISVESIYDISYRLTSYKLFLLFKNNKVTLDCRKYDNCDLTITNWGMKNRYLQNQYVSWKDVFVEDENIIFNFV